MGGLHGARRAFAVDIIIIIIVIIIIMVA